LAQPVRSPSDPSPVAEREVRFRQERSHPCGELRAWLVPALQPLQAFLSEVSSHPGLPQASPRSFPELESRYRALPLARPSDFAHYAESPLACLWLEYPWQARPSPPPLSHLSFLLRESLPVRAQLRLSSRLPQAFQEHQQGWWGAWCRASLSR
jgi:hypothetical protein